MALRCPACRSSLAEADGGYTCPGCAAQYPLRHGIVDLLGEPAGSVARELRGMAGENSVDVDTQGWDAMKFISVRHNATHSELLDSTRRAGIQYYQLSSASFFEGLARARLDSGMRVLEIGADQRLWTLRTIRDFCREAYALNIYFQVEPGEEPGDWPTRVLGDMNALPFTDGFFDLVISSATLHHSPDLPGALSEVARVLCPGGRAVVVNEPVEGFAKRFGRGTPVDRNALIHEQVITLRQWRAAIAGSGLRPHHFLPAWFATRLGAPDDLPAGTRFASLARRLRPLVRPGLAAELLTAAARIPGQAFLGLPLNAVLWKPAGASRPGDPGPAAEPGVSETRGSLPPEAG